MFDTQVSCDGISRAWAGGLNGRKVIDRFLSQCSHLLSDNGRVYLLLVKENFPEEVMQVLKSKNIDCEIVLKRKCRNEHLLVVRGIKQKS
jgi:release factor glutamine methyltransferase